MATSGKATVRMPKPKGMRFITAIVERCRCRETSVEEAMTEMRLAGASTRRTEDAGEAPWGASAPATTVSNLDEKAFESVERRRSRPPTGAHPHAYVDGICPKHTWGGACENASAMVAIGVNDDGCCEATGAAEGFTEPAERRRELLSWPKSRGLRGVRMLTGDKAAGMVGALAEVLPVACQRCTVRFCRNVFSKVPRPRRKAVAAKPKAAHARESFEAGGEKSLRVAADLESMRLKEAAKVVREGHAETLTCTRFPTEHWKRMLTNNAIERLNREVRRRTRVVGTFPDGKSALMLVTARPKYVAESEWGSRRYLDVTPLESWSCRRAIGLREKVRKHLDGTRVVASSLNV